jgi:hypothetical protein
MKKLVACAKELNEVMGLEPPIKVVAVKKEDLTAKLKEAAEWINPIEDDISEESMETLKELGFWPEEKEEEKFGEEGDPEDLEEEEEEVPAKKVKKEKEPKAPKEKAPKKEKAPGDDTKKFPKREGSMAQYMDGVVTKGGTWEEMLEDVVAECKERKVTICTLGGLKAHVKYRLSKNEEFLGKLKMTEKGIQ